MIRRLTFSSLLLALMLSAGSTLAVDEEPPATGTFTPAGSLAEARVNHTATLLLDGRVLVVGGFSFNDGYRSSAEVWDPASATFDPAGSLAEARSLHTATLLHDGRVLVVGGWGDDFALPTAEVWDPATASFEPADSLAEPASEPTAQLAVGRVEHTATLLPDDRILVIGGKHDGSDAIASAEVWDPAAAAFEPAGSLAEARSLHTATLLPDGRVLVVGGWGDLHLRASAEVWEPGDG